MKSLDTERPISAPLQPHLLQTTPLTSPLTLEHLKHRTRPCLNSNIRAEHGRRPLQPCLCEIKRTRILLPLTEIDRLSTLSTTTSPAFSNRISSARQEGLDPSSLSRAIPRLRPALEHAHPHTYRLQFTINLKPLRPGRADQQEHEAALKKGRRAGGEAFGTQNTRSGASRAYSSSS